VVPDLTPEPGLAAIIYRAVLQIKNVAYGQRLMCRRFGADEEASKAGFGNEIQVPPGRGEWS